MADPSQARLASLVRQLQPLLTYVRFGDGSPNTGSVIALQGAIYLQTDSGDVWRQPTTNEDGTGWVTP